MDGSAFQEIAERNALRMVNITDDGCVKKGWHLENLKICKLGEWNSRMIVETILSMLTLVSRLKKAMFRTWDYFKTRLAFVIAMIIFLFNGMVFQSMIMAVYPSLSLNSTSKLALLVYKYPRPFNLSSISSCS